MDIPIEIFMLGIGVSIALALFGFIRNPQIPAMLVFGGMFFLMFAVATDNIILTHLVVGGGGSEEVITYHYDVSFTNNDINIDVNETAVAEYVSNSSSVLVGDIVNCIDIMISRFNPSAPSNLTGNAVIGVLDDNSTIINSWVVVPANDFPDIPPDELAPFSTYCFNDYTIQSGDRIGIHYTLATEEDNLNIRTLESAFGFDGGTTRAQKYSTFWEDSTQEQDLTMRLYFVGEGEGTGDIEQVPYQFTELPKVLFALIGVVMMLCGAIMVGRNQ